MIYTIADMVKAGRTTLRGVRWWEKQGLLPGVERSANGYRCYSAEHIRRAKIIAACQVCGMKLSQIEKMLESYNRNLLRELMDYQIEEVSYLQDALPPEFDL